MTAASKKITTYIEFGKKRTFAGAVEWPGWCRSGRDEQSALQALVEYGPRYSRVIQAAKLGFAAPGEVGAMMVVERLKGDTTTDFGSPGKAPAADARPVKAAELQRLRLLLQACWRSFDAAVAAAKGKTLTTGPRGGGRDLEKIIGHVLGADEAYLYKIGWWKSAEMHSDPPRSLDQVRQEILKGLATAVRGELPATGPRGGLNWSPRYFVRRVAWHVLDHAWEIEDRLPGSRDVSQPVMTNDT